MKKQIIKACTVLTGTILISCVVPYEPAALTDREGYIVVEGNISLTSPFTIQISRSAGISSVQSGAKNIKYERTANVYVRDRQNNTYAPVSVSQFGEYLFDFSSQDPDPTGEYQLVIHSGLDGNTYESEFEQATLSGTMELSYVKDETAQEFRILVNSHDPGKNSRYYYWTYIETWDYVSRIRSDCYFNGIKVVKVQEPSYMYRCWKSEPASDILLLETTNLSEDRVKDFPIRKIPYKNIRISQHYSIEVTQTILTPQAYEYLETMRKNSNDVGDLFSPQPNEIRGNIRCVNDPDAFAIGYISVCNSGRQRLSVDCTELPEVYETLLEDTIMSLKSRPYDLSILVGLCYSPYMIDEQMGVSFWNLTRCVDCRYFGGEPVRPSFWPEVWPTY